MTKILYQKNRRLRLFAGPNGSGKSTILGLIDHRFDIGIYVNADEIEQYLKAKNKINLSDFGINKFSQSRFKRILNSHSIVAKARKEGYEIDLQLDGSVIRNPGGRTHSYEAAFLADMIRNELLRLGKKFTFETVMSHSSKINFLRKSQKAGYKNYLYYVSTESPIINVERVKQRVKLGGHPVSESKIESRYFNSLKLVKKAIQYSYRSFIFDNSGKEAKLILEVFKGEEVRFNYSEIPKWIDKYILY